MTLAPRLLRMTEQHAFAPTIVAALLSVAAALSGVLLAPSANAQQFKQPTIVSTANWPSTVTAPDLNNDGKADLCYVDYAVAGSASTLHCLVNSGGTFAAPAVNIGVPAAALSYATGDIDGDGNADFVTFGSAGTGVNQVAVHFGDGLGNVSSRTVPVTSLAYSASNPTWSYLATAKFTASGHTDFIAEDTANANIIVTTGDGTGFFAATPTAVISVANDGPGPILVGDFDHDGNTDFLVVNQTSDIVTPYYGKGDGTFRPDFAYTLPGGIFSALVADINGDGIPDLIVEGANGALSVFLGVANGPFSRTAIALTGAQDGTIGAGGHLIGVADLNGDGVMDVVTSTPAGISVLLGKGSLTYSLLGIYNGGPGRSSYVLKDFNGDGQPDLAIDSPEGVAVLLGSADGSFQTSRSYATGAPAYEVAVGQFTGSGNVDAVAAIGIPQLQFMAGDGHGGFAATGAASPAGNTLTNSSRTLWSHITTGDFDGDGNADIALTQDGKFPPMTGDGLTVQFGNGDGTFSAPVQEANTTASPHYGFSAVGDFDGDGKTDIANIDTGFYATYTGGAATRAGTMPRTVLYYDSTVDVADNQNHEVDLDAYDKIATGFFKTGRTTKPDIILQDDASLFVYLNNGDGTFTKEASLSSPAGFAVAPGTTGALPSSGYFPGSMVIADLDGDGNGDLVVAYHNLASDAAHPVNTIQNMIYIWWGNGDGTFTSTPTILTPSRNFYQVAVADMDGDGTNDLVLSDGYVVSVMHGNGASRTFGPEQHFLGGMGINLAVPADVNKDGSEDLVLANGGSVLIGAVVNQGVLATNAEVNTGAITVLTNGLLSRAVTGTLTASPEPSVYGADFTLTATLVPPTGGTTPTGSVVFSVDGASVGTGTVTNGVATFDVVAPTYIRGAHTLSAVYSGDGNYNHATLTGTHSISGLRSQTVYTNTTPQIYYGQVADGSGTVTAIDVAPNVTVDGGFITFYDGATAICMLPVTGAPGTCPPNAGAGLNVGTHIITADYSGNNYYDPSDSMPTTTVVIPDNTQGAIVSSVNPANVGQAVTFTATFAAPYATPVGTVTFYDGTNALGSAALSAAGVATFTTSSLSLGTHPITASLASSLNFNGSATTALQELIVTIPAVPEGTVTLLNSSLNPSIQGEQVKFTAAVATTGSFIVVAKGSVTFSDGGALLGTGTLDATGTATYSTTALSLGNHVITASYAGDAITAASASAPLTQVVEKAIGVTSPSFVITVNPTYISVGIGSAATATVTVTALGDFPQQIALSCTNQPDEAVCAFGTAIIPVGGGTTLMALSPAAPHNCGSTTPYFVAGRGSLGFPVLAAGVLVFFVRRKRALKGIALAAMLCTLPLLGGCGNCTDLGVRPGTYTFQVTGTAVGTPASTASATVKMYAHL